MTTYVRPSVSIHGLSEGIDPQLDQLDHLHHFDHLASMIASPACPMTLVVMDGPCASCLPRSTWSLSNMIPSRCIPCRSPCRSPVAQSGCLPLRSPRRLIQLPPSKKIDQPFNVQHSRRRAKMLNEVFERLLTFSIFSLSICCPTTTTRRWQL